MTYHQKSFYIFFSVITIILLGVVGYFYFKNIYPIRGNLDLSWDQASFKIKTNLGGCPASFPCYETYELNSELALDGNVFHNGYLQGSLSEKETKKLIKTIFNLYQNRVCTPFYTNNVTENYELTIDRNVYKFGNNQGCKEIQDVFNVIKGAAGV